MSTGTPDVPNNGHDRSLRAGSKAGASPRRPVASSHEVRRAPHVSSRSNFFFWVSAPRYRGVACPTRPCAARGTASTSTSTATTGAPPAVPAGRYSFVLNPPKTHPGGGQHAGPDANYLNQSCLGKREWLLGKRE